MFRLAENKEKHEIKRAKICKERILIKDLTALKPMPAINAMKRALAFRLYNDCSEYKHYIGIGSAVT